MRPRGILGGVLALIILQVLASRGGSKNLTGLLGAVATFAKRAGEPGVAAIPNVAGSSGGKTPPGVIAPPSPGTPAPAPGPSPAPRPTTFGPNNSPVLIV